MLIVVAASLIAVGALYISNADRKTQTYDKSAAKHKTALKDFLDAAANETPARVVTIARPFYLSRTEITIGQWQAVMQYSPLDNSGRQFPVDQVRWTDCQAFLIKLTVVDARLPNETEWEYACRAGAATKYSSGNTLADLRRVGWCSYDGDWGSAGRAKPVGSFDANAWGAHDMHGNVIEWVESERYERTPKAAGKLQRDLRVVRGGSWLDEATACRSAVRYLAKPAGGYDATGFRIVLDIAPSSPK
jgi:formylglycine-generating enzyme required for sulfatase activity